MGHDPRKAGPPPPSTGPLPPLPPAVRNEYSPRLTFIACDQCGAIVAVLPVIDNIAGHREWRRRQALKL